jgi:pimeloyl-ACP methyl ester carboxylesterase
MESKHVELGGPVHYADFGGNHGPPIVLVHGLGGSHLNWSAVGPSLASRGRVLAPDLVGFGRTRPDSRSSSIDANLVVLDRFLREVVREPAIVIGNSMGGMLSMRQAAANPASVSALILVGPALIRPPRGTLDRQLATIFALQSVPLLGERMLKKRRAKVSSDRMVDELLALCCVDPSRISPALIVEAKALARERGGWAGVDDRYLEAARSLMRLLFIHAADVYADIASVKAPTLVVHGTHDRLVPIESSMKVARRRPDWRIEVLEDTGHIPQLEAPEMFLQRVNCWLDGVSVKA